MESAAEPSTMLASTPIDIMNEPQPKSSGKSPEEADTCRICRVEGTEDDPLFYPCKCSGSIKFVHQECLMEWLSHSQKKHCELCKTPFRFTKLYHPQMPKSLPTTVFLRKAAFHTMNKILFWCRAMLVTCVWLFWLPWSMRFVWRGLFWIADAGWTQDLSASGVQVPSTHIRQGQELQFTNTTWTTTPFHGFPSLSSALFPLSKLFNFSTEHSTLSKWMFSSITFGNQTSNFRLGSHHGTPSETLHHVLPGSILSGIPFFQSLTPSPMFNTFVTDILEGQIITLSVVVAFILVFLIREWVVQQQPIINLAALNAGQQNNNEVGVNEDDGGGAEVQEGEVHVGVAADASAQDVNDNERESSQDTSHKYATTTTTIEEDDSITPAQDKALIPSKTWPDVRFDRADEAAVERLYVALSDAQANLQLLGRFDQANPQGPSDSTDIRHAANLVIEVRETHIALQKHAARAFEHKDPDILLNLLPRLDRFTAALLYLPDKDATDIEANVKTLKEWIQSVVLLLGERTAILNERSAFLSESSTNSNLPDTLCTTLDYLDSRERGLFGNGIEGETIASASSDKEASNTQSRPIIPLRSEQSIATYSQTSLQEGLANDGTSPDSSRADEHHGTDIRSDDSSESWQEVQVSDDVSSGTETVQAEGHSQSRLFSKLKFSREASSELAPFSISANAILASRAAEDKRVSGVDGDFDMSDVAQKNLSKSKASSAHRVADQFLISENQTESHLPAPEFQATTDMTLALGGIDAALHLAERNSPSNMTQIAERPVDLELAFDTDTEAPTYCPSNHAIQRLHEPSLLTESPATLPVPVLVESTQTIARSQSASTEPIETIDQDLPGAASNFHEANLSFSDRVLDWLWGDLVPAEQVQDGQVADEHIIEDLIHEAQFVPVVDVNPQVLVEQDPGNNPAQDPEVVVAAAQAAIDPNEVEAVDEIEDLEGIMELIGMQGPVTGLFQNAIFSALLISATVTSTLWFPYLWGKVFLLLLAHPFQLAVKAPLRLISGATNFVVDFCLFLGAVLLHWVDTALRVLLPSLGWLSPGIGRHLEFDHFSVFGDGLADSTSYRMKVWLDFFISNSGPDAEYPYLSLSSHTALRTLQANAAEKTTLAVSAFKDIRASVKDSPVQTAVNNMTYQLWSLDTRLLSHTVKWLAGIVVDLPGVVRSGGVNIAIDNNFKPPSLAADLAHWSSIDRVIAIVAGYAFFAVAGALYLKRGRPFFGSQKGKKIESIILEILQQSGGVFKVILIIGIEMIAFPLYCGLLLDLAMLPLFGQASFQSRVDFTVTSPWTSGFVHWFVGTCYMFHFALFVSMCRKIMRSGVLYFIRDPDDPTFHPVRDVLERNVSSQLRKIAFSGMVYGALVIICLGSVVWSTFYLIAGILPVRLKSSVSILEFPIDLLLYNFLLPFFIHLLNPSKGLHIIYEWWFRKCARALRLSHFLFGEQHNDEEGNVDFADEPQAQHEGRYVRAPASDQVRIPKGGKVFLEVNEHDERWDSARDHLDRAHARDNDHFTKVYIPPWFRIRIGLFVFCVWALTAAAGTSMTVLPLLFGRWILSMLVPGQVYVNDIYAYSVGLSACGAAFYAASEYTALLERVMAFPVRHSALLAISRSSKDFVLSCWRVLYTYSVFCFILPSLFALLLEFYLIMPLHTYLTTGSGNHTVFLIQDWTLGVLYLRIAVRILQWNPDSRPTRAMHAVVDQGWLKPNARLATRCIVLPVGVFVIIALLVPAQLAWVASRVFIVGTDAAVQVQVQRYAYPAMLVLCFAAWVGYALVMAAGRWRRSIRDEVYLIGERLHNFGEKRPPGYGKHSSARLRQV